MSYRRLSPPPYDKLRLAPLKDREEKEFDLLGYIELTEHFFEIEESLDLFERTADGVHYWERVRFRVHREILQELGMTGQAHTRLPRGLSTRAGLIRRALKNLFHRNPFLVEQRDIAFFGHPRRKRRQDGRWWDIYCDPVIDALDHSYVYFENAYLGRHLSPAKTECIRHSDLVSFVAALRKRLFLRDFHLSAEEKRELKRIEAALNREFGTDVDLQTQVRDTLIGRRMVLPVLETLLHRVEPKLVVLVCGYGKESLIEACRNQGITTVELQHGIMDRYHLGYSFPGNGKKRLFADHLFTFGEYWTENLSLPIPEDRVHFVGYPYFEEELERFTHKARKNQILFISQGTVGAKLSRLALQLSRLIADEWHVVYKLHPGEYDRWQQEYPWLGEAPDVSVVTRDPPLYQLFAESRAQIGVNSTALFEGLGFGLETYLAELPGVERMRPLQARGSARLIANADELRAGISEGLPDLRPCADEFFATGSLAKLQAAMVALLSA